MSLSRSLADVVRPKRKSLEVGHHMSAAPDRSKLFDLTAMDPTPCTATNRSFSSPRSSRPRFRLRLPDQRLRLHEGRKLDHGRIDPFLHAERICRSDVRTLIGKSRSKSASQASWWTTVVTPANKFFHAPASNAARRGTRRRCAMRRRKRI